MAPSSTEAPSLQFPFLKLNDVQVVFSGIPNYNAVISACPPDFLSLSGNWAHAALKLQFGGWTEERMQWAVEHLRTSDSKIAKAQVDYINAWLRSYAPPQQTKQAVCSWLLSLTFRECPQWD
jgi:hypothetical protein